MKTQNMNSSDPRHENEDDDGYLLPFGKISHRARRHEELIESHSEPCQDEDNYLSQDLFHSQTDDKVTSDIAGRNGFSRYSPSIVFEMSKPKKDHVTERSTVESLANPVTGDQQALISGYKVVKVCRGEGISAVIQSSTFEALPHPTKLFRKRKQIYVQQPTKVSQRGCEQHDKDNQSVAVHLKQLRQKQSKIDTDKEPDQINQTDSIVSPGNISNSITAAKVSRTPKEKPSIATGISDWETIESWIHGRWKSNSISQLNKHVEEE